MKIIVRIASLFIVYFILSLVGYSHQELIVKAEDSCSPVTPCEDNSSESTSSSIQINNTFPDNEKACVYHFWGAGCKACASVEDFIKETVNKYPDTVVLKSYEIYYSEENRKLFDDFNERYGVENPGVPSIFIGDTYLGGSSVINTELPQKVEYFSSHKAICPLDYNKISDGIERPKKLELTLSAIVIGALADSVNPCAFAVLTLLLVYLMTVKDKRKMFLTGAVYITVVFIVYFVSGLGLLKLATYLKGTTIVIKIAAIVSILAGIINIKDFFWYGKGISLHIPESKKPIIEKYVKQASIPAAIILGFLVSAFELPCTGGVYLAILGILSKSNNSFQSILYLILYNIIFVIPLWIILLVMYKGINPQKLETFRLKKRKYIRLVMGLIMVLLGFGLLLNLF